jgi:simple sugar transport system permease protein
LLLVPLGLIGILVITLMVFGLPLGESVALLYDGSIGDKFGIHRTIVKSSPLILVALGLVLAWRAGMYNIGGEGQLITGAIAGAAAFQLLPSIGGLVANLMILTVSAVGGAAYAGIAAFMYARRGVNVVISTILLNFVALSLLSFVVRGPLQESSKSIPQSETLPGTIMFLRFDPQSDLHAGVLLSVTVSLVLWLWLSYSPSGFRLRLVGSNPNAARAARIDSTSVQVRSLLWSGALCGLAGGVEYVGVSGYLFDGFSPGWGFLAIPVALIGGLHPIGVLGSGLYFGALVAGSKNLEAFGGGKASLIYAMQGIGVLAFVALHEWLRRNRERVRAV